jgi:hypothetical protein
MLSGSLSSHSVKSGDMMVLKGHPSPIPPLAEGRQFLSIEAAGEQPAPKINVVLNWTAALTQ